MRTRMSHVPFCREIPSSLSEEFHTAARRRAQTFAVKTASGHYSSSVRGDDMYGATIAKTLSRICLLDYKCISSLKELRLEGSTLPSIGQNLLLYCKTGFRLSDNKFSRWTHLYVQLCKLNFNIHGAKTFKRIISSDYVFIRTRVLLGCIFFFTAKKWQLKCKALLHPTMKHDVMWIARQNS